MKWPFNLITLILTPSIALAQGTVVLENQTGLVKQWTSTTDSTWISVPKGGGYVELIAAPAGTALANPLFSTGGMVNYSSLAGFLAANPGWAVVAPPTGINVAAGLFNGANVTINGISPGANADYLLIGWTGPYATYDDAFAADFFNPCWCSSFLGISAIATTATGNPLTTPAGSPISLSTTFNGIVLAQIIIPEPSTFALAGLGALMMLIPRRRRWRAPLN